MTADDTTAESGRDAPPAPADVLDEPHARPLHRLVCLYSTTGVKAPKPSGIPATKVMNLGRFAPHHRSRPADVPWVVGQGSLAPDAVRWRGAAASVSVHELEAYVGRLRHGRVMLALRIEFDGPLRHAIALLREACFDRTELTVAREGRSLALFDALLETAPSGAIEREDGAGFDRDVHQILCAAAGADEFTVRLAGREIRSPRRGPLARYVYRSDEDFRLEYAAFRLPAELNRRVGSAAAHGRGVTVLSGIAEPVENAAILTAVQLLAAASALREIRRRCDETLAALTEVRHRTVPLRERRAVLASLSNELSGMQTALSFEVESQIDAVHVPEIVIEQYQASLAGTLGLALAAETTSKMLDRLTAAIAAASGALERIERESDDDRRYRATLALAVLSVLAVPATLLLGFYGINAREVKGDRSVVDTVYWPAWAVLAAMCLIAAGVGLVLVRRRSQRGEAFEAEATRRLDYAQEQVARWEANEASAPAAGGGAP